MVQVVTRGLSAFTTHGSLLALTWSNRRTLLRRGREEAQRGPLSDVQTSAGSSEQFRGVGGTEISPDSKQRAKSRSSRRVEEGNLDSLAPPSSSPRPGVMPPKGKGKKGAFYILDQRL